MKKILVVLGLLCAFGLAAPAIGQDKAATPPAAEAKATDAKAPDAKAEATPAADAKAADAKAEPAAAAAPPAPTTPQLVAADKINSGDTAWLLTSTALVLMMTIPGLALFYGGMVRKKNVLATLMQSFAITCLVTVLWVVVGYSMAFMPGGSFMGGFERFMLKGMLFQNEAGKMTVSHLALTIPESVYMMFQMTFAIITPALIAGAFADRMKFSAMLWFMALWSVLIYAPIAHMMWEPSGYWATAGVLDFAGGTVVHINAGIAGLVCALVLGKRLGYGREAMAPHNLTLTLIGASLLWVGWFGFNAGSARGLQRTRRHGDVRHAVRHGRRRARVDVHRVDGEGQAVGARHRVGRRRGARRHHAGLRLRRRNGCTDRRHRGRRRLLLRGDDGQGLVQVRRLARCIRRALLSAASSAPS